jgi:chorismate mutase
MTYFCRGIRGATTADANTREAILEATTDMLERLIAENDLRPEDIASAIFSTTPDLNAEFPAVAARAGLARHRADLHSRDGRPRQPGALHPRARPLEYHPPR